MDNIIEAKLTEEANELYEQRVKVDRKKFEQIINGESSETGSAEEFFERIMTETQTSIVWPTKLKPGTKSKKDPHIKIIGCSNGVNLAKERILDYLDGRKNRVTLKMDVAFSDHSHVIGKGGHSIQKVMDDTFTHIHFPDSNRNNNVEKSNQVSIAGTVIGSEQARCRIRDLLPLTVYMEFSLHGLKMQKFDNKSSFIQYIQHHYGLSVNIRIINNRQIYPYTSSSGSATVAIRGTRAQSFALRQGLYALVEYLTDGTVNANTMPITIAIDIASQHHPFVMGRGSCNIRQIMQTTGVVISFPDVNKIDCHQSYHSFHGAITVRKSTVIITAPCFESCLQAWQEILGYLPLVLIFDLPQSFDVDPGKLTHLMEEYKVSAQFKPKTKQNFNSIMVKGTEKDSRNLFEVRRQILGLDESDVPVCCEKHALKTNSNVMSMLQMFCALNTRSAIQPPPGLNLNMMDSNGNSINTANINGASSSSSTVADCSNGGDANVGVLPSWAAAAQVDLNTLTQQLSQLSMKNSFRNLNSPPPADLNDNNNIETSPSVGSPSSLNSSNVSDVTSPLDLSPPPQRTLTSLGSLTSSTGLNCDNRFQYGKLSSSSTFAWPDGRGSLQDYEERRNLAAKAFCERPRPTEPRKPTPFWAGYGFSRSIAHEPRSRLDVDKPLTPVQESIDSVSSFGSLWDKNQQLGGVINRCGNPLRKQQSFDYAPTSRTSNASSSSLFSTNSILESMSSSRSLSSLSSGYGSPKNDGATISASSSSSSLSGHNELAEILMRLGLSRYIGDFQQHDIDFNTFLKLNDADLQDLGISYLGRQKISSAINELKRMLTNDGQNQTLLLSRFEAAPGAERSRKTINTNL